MKFKEELDKSKVTYQDNINKLFSSETSSVILELEQTIQEYWNVDRQSANFLNMMVKNNKVKSALEIGTSNGLSSIWIASALKETKGNLITIEYWEKRAKLALDNFKKTNLSDIITVVVGDAMEKKREFEFDFIFIDANKEEYIDYFNSFNPLLKKGGIIIADNILSHYKKTKNYVELLLNHPDYQSQILNFDAGMMLSIKLN